MSENQTNETNESQVEEQGGVEFKYANKFESAGDLEKAYLELQSTMGKKLGAFEGAPEEYLIPDDYKDDPLVSELANWGKENNLNQAGLEKLLETLPSKAKEVAEERYKAEISKLGENAEARIEKVTNGLTAKLGGELVEALAPALTTAESIMALEKLLDASAPTTPANVPANPDIGADRVRAMRFELDANGNRRMETDPEFAKRVRDLESKLLQA